MIAFDPIRLTVSTQSDGERQQRYVDHLRRQWLFQHDAVFPVKSDVVAPCRLRLAVNDDTNELEPVVCAID